MTSLIRAAVCTAALLLCLKSTARADYTPHGLLSYLTGLDNGYRHGEIWANPAMHLDDTGSYVEFAAIRRELYRTLRGPYKHAWDGAGNVAYKHVFRGGRTGMYASYANRKSLISWPFSNNRVRTKQAFDASDLFLSGFLSDGDRFTAGATLGKSYSRKRENILGAIQLSGKLPHGIRASLRVSSRPYDWSVEAGFQEVKKSLPARFRQDEIEGELMVSVRDYAEMTVTMIKSRIVTPGGFRGIADNHAQVWGSDRSRWYVELRDNSIAAIDLSVGYGRETLTGDFDLWYNGYRYLRSSMDADNSRFRITAEGERMPRSFPSVRLDRVITDADMPYGSVDSWPFTPKQLEIIGDKTWTGYGTGRFTSNGCTLFWEISELSNVSTSYARIYPDYDLRIITRDHISSNPLDMIFGRSRDERDITRYADFASLLLTHEFVTGSITIDTGVQQLIPLRHVKKRIPGKAPAPPTFPDFTIKKPTRFGGLSFWLRIRYHLS
jgi:hypothetical protein